MTACQTNPEKQCEATCDSAESCGKQKTATLMGRGFFGALVNAVDLCFDDVYAEPRKILIAGGCRQRDLAQYIALLLPAPEITLVDPDSEIVRRTQEEICCRFKFVSAQLDELPFEDGTFDLVIAHNFFELTDVRNNHWKAALKELFRVTYADEQHQGNVMISHHRKALWGMLQRVPGMAGAMAQQGVALPPHLPDAEDVYEQLALQSRTVNTYSPLPWTVYMTHLKAVSVRNGQPLLSAPIA